MSTLHVIRLRGPWDYTPLARFVDGGDAAIPSVEPLVESAADLPPSGRVRMPCDWAESLGAGFRGRVAFRRRFGRPTGIDDGQRVWLVCEGANARATLVLNGEPLGEVSGPSAPSEFDVTARLHERNELTATVEFPHPTGGLANCDEGAATLVGGLTGEVRLEIRAAVAEDRGTT